MGRGGYTAEEVGSALLYVCSQPWTQGCSKCYSQRPGHLKAMCYASLIIVSLARAELLEKDLTLAILRSCC